MDKILQTVCHNRTVFPVQRHDVSNRSDGNQIQIIVQHFCEMIPTGERADQLECDADTGKLLKRIGTVRPLGIDDRKCVWELIHTLMMVGNDHF